MNPLYANANDTDADLTKLVYSGLVRWDPNQGLVNDLAQEISLSDDQKTYTIRLRTDARFHNGEPVTAQDVFFTIGAIQDPNYRSPLAQSLRGVVMSVVDDTTITFQLEAPFAPFLSSLTVGILPANIWGEIAPKNTPLSAMNLEPIGSGPYSFANFAKDKRGVIRSYIKTQRGLLRRSRVY